jgi:hypothetical protein
MSVVPRASASSSILLAMLLLLVAGGCGGKKPVADKQRASFARVADVDVWINQPPRRRAYAVLTTEDPTLRLNALAQRDLRMRGDAAVMEAAVRRAKEVGADAVLMVTTGPEATRGLSRMTIFARYEGGGGAAAASPTTVPAAPAAPTVPAQ